MKKLIIILQLFFALNGYDCIAQDFRMYNDSNSLKKEIFKKITDDFYQENFHKKFKYKSYVNTYTLLPGLKSDAVKKGLLKHFSSSIVKQICYIHPRDDFYTDWLEVYNNNPPDSIIFIKQRFVDDFFYIQDSIKYFNFQEKRRVELQHMITIEPFIFSVTTNKKMRLYAVVFFSLNQKERSDCGQQCSLSLFEKKGGNGKW